MTDIKLGVFLKELIEHTYQLPGVEIVRFDTTQDSATAFTYARHPASMIHVKTLGTVTGLPGKGGFNNLDSLKAKMEFTNLETDEVTVGVVPMTVGTAEVLQVIKENGTLIQHQLFNPEQIDEVMKRGVFKGTNFSVSGVQVSDDSIKEFKEVARLAKEPLCKFTTEKDEKSMYCTIAGTMESFDAGAFSFLRDVALDSVYTTHGSFPCETLLKIFETQGEKRISFGKGFTVITVTTDIAEYTYSVVTLTK